MSAASFGSVQILCCGANPAVDLLTLPRAKISEINAQCDGELDYPRRWRVYLWEQRVHKALIFTPQSTIESFEMRVVDAIIHKDLRKDVLIGSYTSDWGIAMELHVDPVSIQFGMVVSVVLLDQIHVNGLTDLGTTDYLRFHDSEHLLPTIASRAEQIINQYTRYDIFGTNCQHFVEHLAKTVGIAVRAISSLTPLDEVLVKGLSCCCSVSGAFACAEKAGSGTAILPQGAVACAGIHGCTFVAHNGMYIASTAVAWAAILAAGVYGTYKLYQHTQRETSRQLSSNSTMAEYHVLYIDGYWNATAEKVHCCFESAEQAHTAFDSLTHARALVVVKRKPQLTAGWLRVCDRNSWHRKLLISWIPDQLQVTPESSFDAALEY